MCNFAVHQSEVLQEILSLLAGFVEVSGGEGGLLGGKNGSLFHAEVLGLSQHWLIEQLSTEPFRDGDQLEAAAKMREIQKPQTSTENRLGINLYSESTQIIPS